MNRDLLPLFMGILLCDLLAHERFFPMNAGILGSFMGILLCRSLAPGRFFPMNAGILASFMGKLAITTSFRLSQHFAMPPVQNRIAILHGRGFASLHNHTQ